MRQVKNRNKPAQVVEMDAHDHAIAVLTRVKAENAKKRFVRVPIEKGWLEIEETKYNNRKIK